MDLEERRKKYIGNILTHLVNLDIDLEGSYTQEGLTQGSVIMSYSDSEWREECGKRMLRLSAYHLRESHFFYMSDEYKARARAKALYQAKRATHYFKLARALRLVGR